ncbi:MAG: response regulator [Chthoniobacteraceae bacterium]
MTLAEPDMPWLQTTANDLNNLLQVIGESSKALEPMCSSHPESTRYFGFLKTSLERARQVTEQLASRIGGEAVQKAAPHAVPAAPETPAAVSADSPAQPKGLILIIDDEELLVTLVKQMLTDAGYRVVASLEPFLALEVFKQLRDQVDLVILDFTLPIMDGSEVFTALRGIKPDVAVMLSSGFTEHEKIRAMLSQGLCGFLPKPYTREKLLSQVNSTLAAIRARKTR